MAILDTFYILFKSDTGDFKKGAAEVESALKSLIGLFAGFASASAVLGGFKNAISEITTIGNISRQLNVNVEALDAWGHAVQRTGGTAAQFQQTLSSLSAHFGTTPSTSLRLLPNLADTFSKLNQFQANSYGKSLGIDQATIYLLQQGRREVEDTLNQQKRLGVVTQQQVEVTRKYDNALYDAGRAYNTFYRELSVPILPYLTTFINSLIDHKDAVIGAFGAIGLAAVAMGIRVAAANPILALLAASIVAIGVAYEDVRGFVKGDRKTLLGEITGTKSLGQFRQKNNARVSRLPDWVQKLLGTKAPDYALRRNQANIANNGLFNAGLAGSSGTKNTTVNINKIEIATQATDAQGLSLDVRKSLTDQLYQLNAHVDDGVMA